MKLQTLFIYLLSIAFYFNLQAQKGSLSYEMQQDDPSKANNIGLNLVPLAYDGSRDDLSVLGAGIGGLYWSEKFMVEGNFFYAYFDRLRERVWLNQGPDGEVLDGLPVGGGSPTRKWDIGGTYFFKSNTLKEKETRLWLMRAGQNNTYSMIPMSKIVLLGANLGLGGFSGQFNVHGSDNVKAVEVESGEELDIDDSESERYYFSRKAFTYLELGISRNVITNFKGDFDIYGVKSRKKLSSVYFNALIGLASQLEDFVTESYVGSDIVETRYNLDENTKFNPLGFEIGYQEKSLSGIGFTYNVAAGVRPGYHKAGANFFAIIGMNIFLSTRK